MSNHQVLSSIRITAERMRTSVASLNSIDEVPRLKSVGTAPELQLMSDELLLPPELTCRLDPNVARQLLLLIRRRLVASRDRMLESYHQTLPQLAGLEEFSDITDESTQMGLCRLVEGFFSRYQHQVCDGVRRIVSNQAKGCSQKTSTFSKDTTSILEKAFSNSDTLTTLECQMVAKAAGITHQQVRTWFQNKRNRDGRKNRRIASTSTLNDRVTEPVVPTRRVISGLPARAKLPVITDENIGLPLPGAQGSTSHPGGGIRTIRGLPKRKSPVPASSPSESLSSLGSISPSGGFQSPLESVGGETNVSIPVGPREQAQGWIHANGNIAPFDLGQLVTRLQPSGYCDYSTASQLAALTLAKTPSNLSIRSDQAHASTPLMVTCPSDGSAPNTEGEEDILALLGELLTGVGAGDDYDFFSETLDVSNFIPSFKPDSDDPYPMAPNELDELNAYFDQRRMEEEEETRVTVQDVESDHSSIESGRSTPSQSGATSGSTEPPSSSQPQEIPAIAVSEETTPSRIEIPTLETAPQAVSSHIESSGAHPSEVSSEPDFDRRPIPYLVARPPASVVSDSTHTPIETESLRPYEDPAFMEPPPLVLNPYHPYVEGPQTHEPHPSYWGHPAVPAPRYYQPHAASQGYHLQSTPFQPFEHPESEQTHWIPGALPFDNPDAYLPPDVPYYEQTQQPHLYPVPMVEPQEWVMVPRSSVTAAYAGPHVPQPHRWHF